MLNMDNASEIERICKNAADQNKDFLNECHEISNIIKEFIINSDDKEFKEKMFKVYEFINRPRIFLNK